MKKIESTVIQAWPVYGDVTR